MISKELLSEALGKNALYVKIIDNTIYYETYRSAFGVMKKSINIHELAHKCKEWALDLGYELVEKQDVCMIFNGDLYITSFSSSDLDYDPNRVFKCCEYILEQKAKS